MSGHVGNGQTQDNNRQSGSEQGGGVLGARQSKAAGQGPASVDYTRTWIWHQELQDSSFCNALLDELESLLTDVRAGLMDGILMNTMSLLLTRVLASSPSEDVSQRAITLLRSVRRKTFSWVQELSYDLVMAPTNKERSSLMRDMASTCRSTFDIDPAAHRNLFHSAEDVDALLSCAFFLHTLHPHHLQYMKMKYPEESHFNRLVNDCERDQYSQLLLQRDFYLSLALEQFLKDAICADASDYAVDLAVSRTFASFLLVINRARTNGTPWSIQTLVG